NLKSKSISLAITALLALSFLALIPIAVSPVHAQTAPTISPQVGVFTPGNTVTLTVTWSGASPSAVTIYAMPSPSCLNLASGTIIYGPTVIATGTGIPLVLTAADTNLCASVNGLTSGVTSYSVATPLSSYIA